MTDIRGKWHELEGDYPMLDALLGGDDPPPMIVGQPERRLPAHTFSLTCRLCQGPVWFGEKDREVIENTPGLVAIDSVCMLKLTTEK